MKRFGFTLATILIVALLAYAGYAALRGLKDPKMYIATDDEKIGDIHRVATSSQDRSIRAGHENAIAPATTTNATSTPAIPADSLEGRIQNLLTAKTTLKIGSKGPAVGTIQEFMNLYFKKSLKVDNDFGKTLEANVRAFQKANGITQTGQVGTQGLTKMVEWLKKQ